MFYSRSRFNHPLSKIQGFEDWFYTGGSRKFGHMPSKKGNRR